MALKLGDSLLGALLVGLERLTRDDEPMQRRAGLRLLVAQRRQLMRGDRLEFRRLGLLQRALLHAAPAGVELLRRALQLLCGELIGEKRRQRLILADLRRKPAVFRGLARLALQAVGLAVDLLQHVFEAREIFRRGVEAQLSLVPARMQPGDAGGVFKNAAARLRLGRNDLADLALAHERGRARAGGGVGEEKLHVAGAHLAAVDPVGRALLALDSARHLDRVGVVEGRRRRARRIVEHQADFGEIARRARAAARENHVVHAGRAHVFIGVFAHHPAQGFDEIRLAAAIGADDAGQARLDQEIGRLAEALEAQKAQALEFHCSKDRHKLQGKARKPTRYVVGRRYAKGAPEADARRISPPNHDFHCIAGMRRKK